MAKEEGDKRNDGSLARSIVDSSSTLGSLLSHAAREQVLLEKINLVQGLLGEKTRYIKLPSLHRHLIHTRAPKSLEQFSTALC